MQWNENNNFIPLLHWDTIDHFSYFFPHWNRLPKLNKCLGEFLVIFSLPSPSSLPSDWWWVTRVHPYLRGWATGGLPVTDRSPEYGPLCITTPKSLSPMVSSTASLLYHFYLPFFLPSPTILTFHSFSSLFSLISLSLVLFLRASAERVSAGKHSTRHCTHHITQYISTQHCPAWSKQHSITWQHGSVLAIEGRDWKQHRV